MPRVDYPKSKWTDRQYFEWLCATAWGIEPSSVTGHERWLGFLASRHRYPPVPGGSVEVKATSVRRARVLLGMGCFRFSQSGWLRVLDVRKSGDTVRPVESKSERRILDKAAGFSKEQVEAEQSLDCRRRKPEPRDPRGTPCYGDWQGMLGAREVG